MRFKLILALGTVLTSQVQASGFALIEQNASGMGNAYAGQAAVAEDASTIYFNPAGMTYLPGHQIVVAGHFILPSAKFTGTSTAPTGSDGGNAGESAFVPNFYYSMDIGQGLKFGIGLNAPFGLTTEYDRPWDGQALAVKSELKTYNLNPSVAWRVNEHLSLGVGLNWQRIEAELTSFPGIPVSMTGDDEGSWSWNAGAIWDMDGASRLGLAYRASMEHRLKGNLVGIGVTPAYADLELPASVSASYWRRLNAAWEVLADATWTQWSDFKYLDIHRQSDDFLLSRTEELWENTFRFSVGLNYHPNRAWTWRMGLAYDQSPVPDADHRTPRIPDNDRTWVSLGGQYRMNTASAVDFGYSHIFVKDGPVTHTSSGVTLTGSYDNKIDILSVQYTHSF